MSQTQGKYKDKIVKLELELQRINTEKGVVEAEAKEALIVELHQKNEELDTSFHKLAAEVKDILDNSQAKDTIIDNLKIDCRGLQNANAVLGGELNGLREKLTEKKIVNLLPTLDLFSLFICEPNARAEF